MANTNNPKGLNQYTAGAKSAVQKAGAKVGGAFASVGKVVAETAKEAPGNFVRGTKIIAKAAKDNAPRAKLEAQYRGAQVKAAVSNAASAVGKAATKAKNEIPVVKAHIKAATASGIVDKAKAQVGLAAAKGVRNYKNSRSK
jgi:hypothetical protein